MVMGEENSWPEPGEFVVCTVKKVADFGAFVELEEYAHKEGFIHISEVASGWVKHIRDHVKEEQKVVCKVLYVDAQKRHIDISLKDVNEHQRRAKIQEWKNELKAEKWLTFFTQQHTLTDEELSEVRGKLKEAFGLLYLAFEEAALKGPEALVEAGISKEYAQGITVVASENIKTPHVSISGYLDLFSVASDGVEVIKCALRECQDVDEEEVSVELTYVGAPRYRVKVTAPNYKMAENALRKTANKALAYITAHDGEGKFFRYNEPA